MTKNEYGHLLDLLYIADWILSSNKIEDDPKTKKYVDIFQRIYSHAKDFGFENLVDYDEDIEEYFQDNDFLKRHSLHEIIDEYDDETFWQILINRLIDKDMPKHFDDNKQLSEADIESQLELEYQIREKYENELSKNGLNNIKIDI